jgi:branched-chain amino acid transport system ATP-binding protein
MLLEIKDISINYGKAKAVEKVSLEVGEGEVVSIVGANGAGKTTILKALSGLKKISSGEIWFQNKKIDTLAPDQIVKMGIVQVPSGRMIFSPMTVLDNLKLGAYLRRDRDGVKRDLENIYQSFPILKERQSQLGGQLSGGEQQMLALGRALLAKPRLLLMDEPSMGLAPIMVAEVGRIIQNINKQGISILLVEQNCRMALKLANRAYVLELGKVSLQGEANCLANDDRIKKCYLGGI